MEMCSQGNGTPIIPQRSGGKAVNVSAAFAVGTRLPGWQHTHAGVRVLHGDPSPQSPHQLAVV